MGQISYCIELNQSQLTKSLFLGFPRSAPNRFSLGIMLRTITFRLIVSDSDPYFDDMESWNERLNPYQSYDILSYP